MKAICLISGGLDSILAARLIKEQGIEVVPTSFFIPFLNRSSPDNSKDKTSLVREALGEELRVIDISNEFLKMLENPVYGFGSNMNPCIDCKILMFSRARQLMQESHAQFIVTGEVLGQRPMSQHRQALQLIEKKSGLEGYLLRPLSAKNLSETVPEKNGWVRRSELMNFSGRSRKPQIELARIFKITGYPNPAGGCLLTDPGYASRLKDLINHKELNLKNTQLLKLGRHFRFSEDAKLIVGRDEGENRQLLKLAENEDYLFMPQDSAGPTCLGIGVLNDELIRLSCALTCRYCDRDGKAKVSIAYRKMQDKEKRILEIEPMQETEIVKYRI